MPRLNIADRLSELADVYNGFDPAQAQEAVTALSEALEEITNYREEAMQSVDEAVGQHEEREWDSRNEALSTANDANENLIASMENLEGLLEAATESVRAFLADAEGKPEAARDHFDHFEM